MKNANEIKRPLSNSQMIATANTINEIIYWTQMIPEEEQSPILLYLDPQSNYYELKKFDNLEMLDTRTYKKWEPHNLYTIIETN